MTALVSVIVPVYRVEELLRRCVDSILAQTHQNLEMILVDDGSPDGCGRICDEYARTDRRVLVIHQDNGGLSAARNSGLDAAHGDYITFVDADDWIGPSMVAELLRLADGHEAEIAICGHLPTSDDAAAAPAGPAVEHVYSNVDALAELLGPDYITMVVSWGKLYQAALFVDLRFPIGRVHEDEFTTHRLLHRARRVVRTEATLYYYWQRPGSITSTMSPDRRADQRAAFRARAAFLASVGLQAQADPTYRKAFWMTVRERRRSAERPGRRTLDREVRALTREIWKASDDLDLRLRVLAYAVAPGLVDTLARCHGTDETVARPEPRDTAASGESVGHR